MDDPKRIVDDVLARGLVSIGMRTGNIGKIAKSCTIKRRCGNGSKTIAQVAVFREFIQQHIMV